MADPWIDYECEGQIELEDYLKELEWDSYFATCMNPPEETKDESE